jgi:hypothetical protein
MAKSTHPKTQAMKEFNTVTAPQLADEIGVRPHPDATRWSKRFFYGCGKRDELVIIAGDQEGEKVDLALAYGLTYRGDQPLVLVLPEDRAFPTLQRAPWLETGAPLSVYVHNGRSVNQEPQPLPKPEDTVERVAQASGKSPEVDLRTAMAPPHFGTLSDDMVKLVEWATKHPILDPGHRQNERAWHCMGQRVLSMRRGAKEPTVRAGIHTTKTGEPVYSEDDAGTAPAVKDLATIKEEVGKGIGERLFGAYRDADEHWLQAVIRRDPTIVGVEQPALREIPAWRPVARKPKAGQPGAWGRGFIDIAGVDGQGNLRIVETKLAVNDDELLIFQGLDYYIWACAYREALLQRLGAPKDADIVVHYVIGDDPTSGAIRRSHFVDAQAAALSAIPWHVQTIHHWFGEVYDDVRPAAKLYLERTLPAHG